MQPNIPFTKFSPSGKVAYATTNYLASLDKESVHADFHSLMDFLRNSPISYALTASPPIYAEIVQEMWSTADCSSTSGGIKCTIKGNSYTITPSVINEALHLPHSNFENTPTQNEIISMLKAINYAGHPWSLSQIVKNKFRKEWSYFFDTLNKGFSGRCSSFGTINIFVLKLAYSLLYGRRIDIGNLLLDEFSYKLGAVRDRDYIIFYARFLMIIANHLCKELSIEDRNDTLQVPMQTRKLFASLVTKNLNAEVEFVLPEHVRVQLSTLYSSPSHTSSLLLPPTMEDVREHHTSPTQEALPSLYQSGTVATSSVSQSCKRKSSTLHTIAAVGNEGNASDIHSSELQLSTFHSLPSNASSVLLPATIEGVRQGYTSPSQVALPSPYQSGTVATFSKSAGKRKKTTLPTLTENEENETAPEVHLPQKKKDAGKIRSLSVVYQEMPPADTRDGVPAVELPSSLVETNPVLDLLEPAQEPDDRKHLMNAASVLKSQLVDRLISCADILSTEDMILLANKCFTTLKGLGDNYTSFCTEVNKLIAQHQQRTMAAKKKEDWNEHDIKARYTHQSQFLFEVRQKLSSAQDRLSSVKTYVDSLKFKKAELTGALLELTKELHEVEESVKTLRAERDQCKEAHSVAEAELVKLGTEKEEALAASREINDQYNAANEVFKRMCNHLLQLKFSYLAFLDKESVHADFHSLMDFLKHSPISYALTASPPIYAEIVQEMWSTADCSSTSGGIKCTIKGNSYTINPSVINEALHLPHSNFENTPTQNEIISMLKAINYAGNPWSLGQIVKNKFRKEWSYFFDTLNKGFSGRCSSFATINIFVLKLAYSLLYGRRIDIGKLLIDEFSYKLGAVRDRDQIIYYVRFLMIIANYLCKELIIGDRNDTLQVPMQTKKLFASLVTKNLNAEVEFVLPEHVRVQLSTIYSSPSHTSSLLLPPPMEDVREGYTSPSQVALPSPDQSGTVATSSVSQSCKRKSSTLPFTTEGANEGNKTASELQLSTFYSLPSQASSLLLLPPMEDIRESYTSPTQVALPSPDQSGTVATSSVSQSCKKKSSTLPFTTESGNEGNETASELQLSTFYSLPSHKSSLLLPPTMEGVTEGYSSPSQVALPSPYQSGAVATSSVSKSAGKRKKTSFPSLTEDRNEGNETAPEVHLPLKKKDAGKTRSLSVVYQEMLPADTRNGVPAVELPSSPVEEKPIHYLLEPAQEPDDRQHLLNAASVLKSHLVNQLTSYTDILSADDMILLANKCYNTLEGLGDNYAYFRTEVRKLIAQKQELELAAKKKEDWNEWDIRGRYIHKVQSLFEVRQKLSSAQDKLSTAKTQADSLKLKKEELTGTLLKLTEELHEVEERVKTLTAERDQCREAHSVAEAELGNLDAKKEEAHVAFKAVNDQYNAANKDLRR